MRVIRAALLTLFAGVLALWHWGPDWVDGTRPLTELVVEAGGTFRAVALPGGDTLQIVSHDIDKYCFSPGRGAIIESAPPTPEDAIRTGAAVVGALAGQALSEGRPNLTVTFERPVKWRWPWTERHQESLVFHHGGNPAGWRITTSTGWLLHAARAFNDSTRASLAREGRDRG